jgi:uncharacterized protein DUF4129
MRSFFGNKRLVLLLAALALGALTVLAISLNTIPFRDAEHFARQEAEDIQAPAVPVQQIQFDIPVWKQLVVVGLLALLVVLVALLLSPKWRKRLFWLLVRGALWVWAIYFLLKRFGKQLFGWDLKKTGDAAADGTAFTPLPTFEPPRVSPVLSYVISFAFALIFLAVIWVLYRGWQRYMLLNTKRPLDEIARIARSSLDDLSSGRNSSDVIINCYLRMSDVVAERRRLRREAAMTPREFALRLEQAGLPGEAVAGLTRLFEGVRYGDRRSGPKDVKEAVSCLETILHYCGELV